jgi:SAM-dependent methyltransferase
MGVGARDPVHHPLFARAYACCAPRMEERTGLRGYRRELLSGLTGRVIEIGAGSGLNFPHYPATVSEVVAIEPERRLRRAAAEAGRRAEAPVDVVPGVAEALPVKSEAFDAAVACLVLCSVRDQRRALAEIRRVLRPGGQLRLLEHVRAETAGAAFAQWTVDHTIWPVLFGGCRTARDTIGAVRACGLRLGDYRRVRIPAGGVPVPSAPHALAIAYRQPEGS